MRSDFGVAGEIVATTARFKTAALLVCLVGGCSQSELEQSVSIRPVAYSVVSYLQKGAFLAKSATATVEMQIEVANSGERQLELGATRLGLKFLGTTWKTGEAEIIDPPLVLSPGEKVRIAFSQVIRKTGAGYDPTFDALAAEPGSNPDHVKVFPYGTVVARLDGDREYGAVHLPRYDSDDLLSIEHLPRTASE